MHNLDTYIQLYGEVDFIRIVEITSPLTLDDFIRRLYQEIVLIIQNIESGRRNVTPSLQANQYTYPSTYQLLSSNDLVVVLLPLM